MRYTGILKAVKRRNPAVKGSYEMFNIALAYDTRQLRTDKLKTEDN